jgi:hypothetical protein
MTFCAQQLGHVRRFPSCFNFIPIALDPEKPRGTEFKKGVGFVKDATADSYDAELIHQPRCVYFACSNREENPSNGHEKDCHEDKDEKQA